MSPNNSSVFSFSTTHLTSERLHLSRKKFSKCIIFFDLATPHRKLKQSSKDKSNKRNDLPQTTAIFPNKPNPKQVRVGNTRWWKVDYFRILKGKNSKIPNSQLPKLNFTDFHPHQKLIIGRILEF